MKLIKKTLLHYQKGNSNKLYNVYLYELSSKTYLVNFEYGRFGANLREGTKTNEPVRLEKAQKLYDALVISKMNKEYLLKEGYNPLQKEKQERENGFTLEEYSTSLVERLKRVGEIENGQLKAVDNYQVSRLIYRAGELRVDRAKELIVAIYKMNTFENSVFYYSVAWALGRFKDSSLRPILNEIRQKLTSSSKYIVEEALFMLDEEKERREIQTLTLPMPYHSSLKAHNYEAFYEQVASLSSMVSKAYQDYKNIESWYHNEREEAKNALLSLLSQVDEVYLKLYVLAVIDNAYHKAFNSILHLLPITEFNFSLYRRLYKMAEIRGDQQSLGALVTLLESKKMACYEMYDYSKGQSKQSIGCSKQYFKKRSYRYLKDLGHYREEEYIAFAKSILLTTNHFMDSFKPFTTWHYSNGWRKKHYTPFATHINFMDILYGGGERYRLESNKKQWESINSNIKDKPRAERYPELWDRHIDDVVDILVESSILEVQSFAFNILKDNPKALENIALEKLLKMMNLKDKEARNLFFEILKDKYAQTKDSAIIKAFILSSDEVISDFALLQISRDSDILCVKGLVVDVLEQTDNRLFFKFINLLSNVTCGREIVLDVLERTLTYSSLLLDREQRLFKIFKSLSQDVEVDDIIRLMAEESLNNRHLLGADLIRDRAFEHLGIPLALKERIAQFDHPKMLATTIYLLGKLSDSELMSASNMLISFLYNKDGSVHNESRKIIERLGQDRARGDIFLKAIVEKSFASATDNVSNNIERAVIALKGSYSVIKPDKLYRMLIAKSRLAVRLGGLILTNYQARDFSVLQWARLAKNPNKSVRVWAYDAYRNNIDMVKEAMPKSLMIFDTVWEDTRAFASTYFETFDLNSDEIVIIADSNYQDVQRFAKKMIERGDYDQEVILRKLSQHPAVTIQKFVTDLMLNDMSTQQLVTMERFFNTIFHSVNQNRVAKTRAMRLIKSKIEYIEVAEMMARLASHHSATMVWADKELFVEAMGYIAEVYPNIELPLTINEAEVREV